MASSNRKRKRLKELPASYSTGFLKEMDRRTELYRSLQHSYDEVLADAGGIENIAATKRALIERFVFLQALLQTYEQKISSDPKVSQDFIGKWIHASNALIGLARMIGMERRTSQLCIDAYLESKRDAS